MLSVASMIVAKLITIQTPLLLGQLIDSLSQNEESVLNNVSNELLRKPMRANDSIETPLNGKPSSLVFTAFGSLIASFNVLKKHSHTFHIFGLFWLALISGYGASRILASGFNELRNALFSRVRFTW
jgi:ABC-type multidrug transport system fused ATPase/permease subunit